MLPISIASFFSICAVFGSSHFDSAAIRARLPEVISLQWECRHRGNGGNSYRYNICNNTYTLVERAGFRWTILDSYGGVRESYRLCSSDYHQINVTISHMRHNAFPRNLFVQFSCIIRMNAASLSINRIEPLDFQNAKYLETLNISNNQITEISARAFQHTHSLEILDLSNNLLSHINNETFKDLSNLRIMHLHNNLLLSINIAFFDTNLALTLNDNILENIHCDSCEELTISELNIANNKNLSMIPHLNINDIIMSNTTVNNLYISTGALIIYAEQCDIQTVEISWLNRLKELYISKNRLTSIANFTALTALTVLDASHNSIGSIDTNIFTHMTNLRFLDISHNLLVNLDQGLQPHIHVLEHLNIGYNRLQSFRLEQIYDRLKTLQIDGNDLTSIDTDIRQAAPLLEELSLNENNFPCSNITTTLVLLKFDGIKIKNSGHVTSGNGSWDYVKGIRCWNTANEDVGRALSNSTAPSSDGASTDNVKAMIEDMKTAITNTMYDEIGRMERSVENKFKQLEQRLVDIISAGNNIIKN